MGGKAHVVGRRDDDTGHGAALQAAHPVGQQLGRHAVEGFEALGDARHRRDRPEVGGEGDKAPARPCEHGAEDIERADLTPVEQQHLTGRPHAGSAATVVRLPPVVHGDSDHSGFIRSS